MLKYYYMLRFNTHEHVPAGGIHARLAIGPMLLLGLAAGAGATGNSSNFTNHATAVVDYQRSITSRTVIACAQLATATVMGGRVVAADAVTPTDSEPEYCRVTGAIPPGIRFVVYLPGAWNGRLYMHGNGGDGGEALEYTPYHDVRMNAVRNGFAAAFTNTGHDAATEPGAIWAHDDPARESDYGYRAVHLTAVATKGLIQAHYGQPVRHAYFDGCSTGGRQGLMEAQRYPGDFDGIVAGAPVFDLPDMLWQYWKNALAVDSTPISAARLGQLGEFIRARHDRTDGVEDGVIGNPLDVEFVPSRDLPHAGSIVDGFTAEELRTLDAIYAPVMIGDREVFPRTVVGSELPGQVYTDGNPDAVRWESAWVGRVVPDSDGRIFQPLILESWFRYLAFDDDDPGRDWRRADPARDWGRMERMRGILRAADPDLTAFQRHGGKLILYHGWADFGVNPLRTIQYVNAVSARSGRPLDEYLRLYLVPGMFHCSGGMNVDRFDLMTPLIDWVEAGRAPRAVGASRMENGNIKRTRPLCPHPEVARYQGSGDPDRAESFRCVATP